MLRKMLISYIKLDHIRLTTVCAVSKCINVSTVIAIIPPTSFSIHEQREIEFGVGLHSVLINLRAQGSKHCNHLVQDLHKH